MAANSPNVQALIDKAGGVVRLASILAVARTTVIGWRDQGSIPGSRVAQISAALSVPSEQVLKLVQPPRARKRRSMPLSEPHLKEADAPPPKPKPKRTPPAEAASPDQGKAA